MNSSLPGLVEAVTLCFESLNGSCPRLVYSSALRFPLYLLFALIVLLILSGNLLVIFIIVFSQHIQTATNYLILSLSIAGFLLGGLVMPPSMVRSLETCWYFGEFFCDFHSTADIILCNTTVWHLTFISIDRYLAICHPMHYQNRASNRLCFAMIVSSWFLASIFGFAITLSHPHVKTKDSSHKPCAGGCFALHAKEIGVEYSLVFFFIPVTVIVTVYARIFFVARRHAKFIHSYTHNSRGTASPAAKDLKATKTLAIVIGNFLFCWTPFFMCNIIDPIVNHSIPSLLYEVLMWFAYMNSMFNPLIYAFFYSWFRETTKVLVNNLFKQ
ncbi:trace amine-associated receptor 11 [Pygocentrus nattereri]|uniref:G-protein coupled receptors family 1 profile domain-containing protein n=1 Tax=Pygocentrus nattereri TaxID=42514 RepID=A0A3B4CXS8_PYGNA|nr:trace amine-associated receptor 11 [Pygocentrus nattereri]